MSNVDLTGLEMWLVRHGESTANAGQATTDYSAIPLTTTGESQAEAVASTCAKQRNWIGMSRYARARDTAKQLLSRYPEIPTFELAVEEFTYLAVERCQNLDRLTRQPLVDAYWARMSPEYCDGGSAESFAGFWRRANGFLGWAAAQQGFGVVFTHEQFIRAVLIATLFPDCEPTTGIMQQFFAMRAGLPIANCSIVRMRFEDQRWWLGAVEQTHLKHAK